MQMRRTTQLRAFCGLAAVSLLAAAGCRNHMPHAFTWSGGGDIIPTHGEPPEGGYYSNWDPYAVELEVVHVGENVNPVQTQHVLVATVKDKDGKPLPNRRVEWIISEGSVGDIVEVDESGWRASRGYKVDNSYAISHTNNFDHVLTLGNDDPSDDITLTEGQTWAVITSPIEGDTHITVYAPGIYDWAKHKVFVVKHWYDVEWECPPPATNPTGTSHEFVTRVTKASDGAGLEGYEVTYKILDGPAGSFNTGGTVTTVRTDANGDARVTLSQSTPAEGTNNVEIDIVRPANIQCCKPPVHIATCQTSKTWIGPKIGITKDCTPRALVGEQFTYNIVVNNPSQVDATNVVVSDQIPDGIEYVSSTPSASASGNALTWSLGSLPGGASSSITVNVRGTRTGTFPNTASVRADQNLQASDGCETVITAPALALEKTCTPAVTMCDTIQYTVIVRNTGDGPANNVTVTDELPDGLESDGGRTKVFNAGNLQPGEAKQATYTARATRTGSFTNRATASADGGLSADASCTTVVTKPNLTVTKQGRGETYIGRQAEYTLTVTNNGDAPARDTVLTDSIPGGLQFVSASDGGSSSGSAVTWSLGTLEPGQSRTVTCVFTANQAGEVRNTAQARAVCADANAEFVMMVKGIPAILLEVVDLEDPDEIGTTETYVITVTNQGSAVDTNIVVTAYVQPEASFVSADGPTGGTADGKTITFAPLPSLAPRAQAVYKVTIRGESAGDTRFKVNMISDNIKPTPVEETESTRFY
jgi:uncharacterized repeat protein (TIGR01451 family)